MWAIHPPKDSSVLFFPDNLQKLLAASAALLRHKKADGLNQPPPNFFSFNVATFKGPSADVKITCTSASVSDKFCASQRVRAKPVLMFPFADV